MKTLKLFFISISLLIINSCTTVHEVEETHYYPYSLNDVLENYDLWYVDVHNTEGRDNVDFLQKAFTITFNRGILYANNNIVDIGKTGNGYGVEIGSFDCFDNTLETSHNNCFSDFRVVEISDNKIRLDDLDQDVSYTLIGYNKGEFDYNKVFYENIEYFLQEYAAWEQVEIKNGVPNPFDDEHYLKFSPNANNTFRSSGDAFGLRIDSILWDYIGDYEIADYRNSDIKLLTLFYDNNDVEEFDLEVITDEIIQLTHLRTNTIYEFEGVGFIQYLRPTKGAKIKKKTRNENRKRTKIVRKKLKR